VIRAPFLPSAACWCVTSPAIRIGYSPPQSIAPGESEQHDARGRKPVRCAIYTRVSTDHGFDQEFNSLDAQYDAASAHIKSQAHAGWTLIRSRLMTAAIPVVRPIVPICKGCSKIFDPGRST
jgi:hypothetical protein